LTHLHAVVFSTVEDDDLVYSGNDTLPYKTTGVWANALDTYYDTVFYFYSNGFVAKDSTIEYVGAAKQFSQIATRVYSPAGNNVMLEYRHYSQPTALAADADKRLMIFTTWQNGNIAVQDDTSILIKFSYAAHEEVKYDDKINPLSQTFRTRYPVLGFSFGSQTNNPVEDITWDNPSQPSRLTYSYTYRADGYPLSAKIFDDALGGEYLKVIYVYTK